MIVVGTIFRLTDPTRTWLHGTYAVRVTRLSRPRRNSLLVTLQHIEGGPEHIVSAQTLRAYVRDGYLKEYP